ncbi:hypothetical protein B566_EDAN011396, partial [Ephemera danica]
MVYAPRPSVSSSSTSPTTLLPALSYVATSAAGSSTATAPLVPGGVPLVPAASGPVVPSSSSGMLGTPSSLTTARGGTFSSRAGPSTPGPSSTPKHATQRLPVVPAARLHTRQHSISAVYDTSLGSQEQIVEKAKQEAYIMQRVTELQRDGLWSEKRLPKVQEPSRAKAHWDYLLEEMVWLAADFAQERKWKKAAAKKCARMVQKYFQDKAIQAQKAEKSQELRIRKIAACIAKEVKTFWNNVHKLVEYKHQTMLEERRRQALDQHLSFIVDQTEKYSSWLAESMGKVGQTQSRPESTSNSLVQSGGRSTPEQKGLSDGEFEPNQSSSDDEETIARAEAEDAGEEQSEELKLLELESTLPLDDVIKSLPAEIREADQKPDDDDFDASEEDSSDDEETIQEQEKAEDSVDHKQELAELEADNDLTVEELLAKYSQAAVIEEVADTPGHSSEEEDEDSGSTSEEDDGSGDDEEEEEGDDKEDGTASSDNDVALSSLLEDVERRRQALDQHLSFIVDQTEKYSSWLAESMGKVGQTQSRPESTSNSLVQSGGRSTPEQKGLSDGEFEPNQSSSDDEETIARAEAEDAGEEQSEELKLLELESTLPLDDVIKSLPAEIREAVQRREPDQKPDDDDFDASEEDSSDDEETIQEQEKAEDSVDHKQELAELEADNDLTVEELLAKYSQAAVIEEVADTPGHSSEEEDEDSGSTSEEDDGSGDDEEEEEGDDKEDGTASSDNDVALSSLLEDVKGMADMDKLAHTVEEYQEYQPTGYTLSSTKVETPVPFLLKHELREYQHVGLEWLVTMYSKRLNGILADEMGLGKTIQTIALLAHLACDKCIWGPHLIVVPTSVMLNWEMEIKKWCPAFKILTYYGSQKERRLKRTGWTKPNAFHICITSYKLVIQDHQSFRRKKWRYLILDEAQNIKNFRSQRWQLLMNFQSQRRLLLTGTPLQNNLMELWSLMHFLMPDVFQSHKEFREWFVNPVTGMIEGNSEYNDKIIRRLHKVLRPFLLRRLKSEVERQLPKKYEHVVMCRLSKRQRFLYDDFMSRAKTRETLASGNLLSVINVLMQLRKVCNHPNLFEVRPTISPFQMDCISLHVPSLICYALDYDSNKHVSLNYLNLRIVDMEYSLSAYTSYKIGKLATPKRLIEEIDSQPSPPPPLPKAKIRLNIKAATPSVPLLQFRPGMVQVAPGTSPVVRALAGQSTGGQGVMLRVTGGSPAQGYSLQVMQTTEGVKMTTLATPSSSTAALASSVPVATNTTTVMLPVSQAALVASTVSSVTRSAISVTTTAAVTTAGQMEGTASLGSPLLQRISRPAGFAQLVQTPTGKHILLTSSPQPIHHAPTAATGPATANTTVLTAGGQRLTVLSKPAAGVITSTITPLNKVLPTATATTASPSVASTSQSNRPVVRVPPLNVTSAPAQPTAPRPATMVTAAVMSPARPALTLTNNPTIHTRIIDPRVLAMAESIKKKKEEPQQPKSIFHLAELEELYKRERKEKLTMLATINARRCVAQPLYGADLINQLHMTNAPASPCTLFSNFPWSGGAGYIQCLQLQHTPMEHRLWTSTEALDNAIYSHEDRVEQLKDIFSRFVMYVPSVNAPRPRLHASHANPSCVWAERQLEERLTMELAPRAHLLHPVVSAMATQFPDPRLIQYDCGKLQVMEKLLRDLKSGSHRVLIFTQMTRMLDVLEAFLNHQGHIYLRLDGATKVDQRQVLMERFNADKRIFAFILSTRSGGIGVNLTGADTVIFYDSDWNPTMDAQAQDRCHRIGQTRDVHIYRLVSEMTVEENILKKANQKRLLGDLAIEGGNFTTAYFKSSTIQELFNVDVSENDATRRMADSALNNLECVLAAAEDETDVQAARTARAEADAELAEFDENIALDDDASPQASSSAQASQQPGEVLSKAEQELQGIIEKLTPIERYAMKIVEESESVWTAEQLAAAEAEIEQQKREWEQGRLKALQEQQREEQEEEELKMAENLPCNMLTYSSRDAHSQSALNNLECVLAAAEDETDVQAARTARAEADAELAEFDENIALDDDASPQASSSAQASQQPGEVLSKAEQELQGIIEKLTPIERYAMKIVEESESVWTAEQLAAAEAEIEQQKREWEQGRLKALQEQQREEQEEEELKMAENLPCNMLTYSSRDAHSQVNSSALPARGRGRPPKSKRCKEPLVSKGVKRKLSSDKSPQSSSQVVDKHQENGVASKDEDSDSEENSSTDEDESEDESSNGSESPNNCIDPNSPRTRSRGTVKINLWTLDVSPILPGVKPVRPTSSMKTSRGAKLVSVAPTTSTTPNSNCVKKAGKGLDSDERECSEVDVDGPANDSLPIVRSVPAKSLIVVLIERHSLTRNSYFKCKLLHFRLLKLLCQESDQAGFAYHLAVPVIPVDIELKDYMWCPPTPPQDDSDVYIDHTLDFLYESTVMSESQLPPVYVRREHKRAREISIGSEREGRPPLKLRRTGDDSAAALHTPRSLFDRPTPALIKMRRDLRLQKYRGGGLASNFGRSTSFLSYSSGLPLSSRPQGVARPAVTVPPQESVPEWFIHEDWALLQAVQTLQELTLNLIIVSPGHTPNWDMVADMVNSVYEANVIPREEGKVQYDPSPKKMKKQKGIYKSMQNKAGRVMRTSQLYIQDNGASFTQLYVERFEVIATAASRRTPTMKPRLGNPTLRNPKHATVLAENGISYDSPLSPIDVAQRRHERIAKLKSAQVATQQQQDAQQQTVVAAATSATLKGVMSVASPANSQSATAGASSQAATLVVGLAQQATMVPQPTSTTVVTATVTTVTTVQPQQLSAAVMSVAGGTTEMVAAAAANRVSQASGGGLVSVAQLPSMQTQRIASTSLVAAPSSAAVAKANVKSGAITTSKTLNQTTVQLYRQQQVLQQRQREAIKNLQQQQAAAAGLAATSSASGTAMVSTVGGQKMSVGVANPGASSLGVTALQVTHQRSPQYLKQGATVVGKQTAITRAMTEVEMNALLKRQQQQQQQQKALATAVAANTATSQVAQMQLPGQSITSSPSASPQLVPQTVQLKTAMVPGTKVTAATQQQLRQLTLHQLQQKKLPQQKATGKAGVPTQVILQSQKTLPTVTMQQLQLFK